jgi:hypothetical protein
LRDLRNAFSLLKENDSFPSVRSCHTIVSTL